MKNLLTLNYWFNFSPGSFIYVAQVIFVAFLLLLFVAGIFFMIHKRKKGQYKVLSEKLYEFSFVNLFLGFLLFFFDNQGVRFFSARFWFLIWIVIMIYWLINIFKKFGKIIIKREERKKQEQFKKYLP